MITEKKMFKIGELTKLLGITSRTVRYYDQFGLLPHIKRSEGNVRLFDEEDVEIIKKIRFLQHEEMMPLTLIKEKLYGKIESEVVASILTDNQLALSSEVVKSLEVVTEFDPATNKSFYDFIEENIKQSIKQKLKSIFIFIQADKYDDNKLESLKTNVSNKINVNYVKTSKFYFDQTLLVLLLAKKINQKNTVESLDLFLQKNIELPISVGIVDGMNKILRRFDDINESVIGEHVMSLLPFYEISKDNFNLKNCFIKKDEAITFLIEKVDQIIETRSKYANLILINYSEENADVNSVYEYFKEKYISTEIHAEKLSKTQQEILSSNSIVVSIT